MVKLLSFTRIVYVKLPRICHFMTKFNLFFIEIKKYGLPPFSAAIWHFMTISGLYYKCVTIIIDAPSVVKVTLQIVASLTIVIDDAS
jgi:hypothetical protein